MSWTLNPGCINYHYYYQYYTWMHKYEKELRNLNNDYFWRNMKNEAERNLPSSPNRSPQHIPYRIQKIRSDIIIKQLSYLLGPDGFDAREYNYDKNRVCMKCGVKIKRLQEYLRKLEQGVRDKVSALKLSVFEMTDEEWNPLLQQVIEEHANEYTPEEIFAVKDKLPSRGRAWMVNGQYGFCPTCWKDTIEPRLGWTLPNIKIV